LNVKKKKATRGRNVAKRPSRTARRKEERVTLKCGELPIRVTYERAKLYSAIKAMVDVIDMGSWAFDSMDCMLLEDVLPGYLRKFGYDPDDFNVSGLVAEQATVDVADLLKLAVTSAVTNLIDLRMPLAIAVAVNRLRVALTQRKPGLLDRPEPSGLAGLDVPGFSRTWLLKFREQMENDAAGQVRRALALKKGRRRRISSEELQASRERLTKAFRSVQAELVERGLHHSRRSTIAEMTKRECGESLSAGTIDHRLSPRKR
jgi:hypothetical protein